MEILTNGVIAAREAFDAMMAGKPVVCRKTVGSLLGDYSPISDFAADIFTNSEFEFAIQIEIVTVAGIEFTKPFTLDELKDGDVIYVIDTTGEILKGQFNILNADLVASVKNGFAQRNEENAINQIKAWHKTIGLDSDLDINIKEYSFLVPKEEKPKNKPKATTKNSQSTTSNDVAEESSPTPVETIPPAISAVPVWREYKDKITACETYEEIKALEAEILDIDCIKQGTDKLTIKGIKSLISAAYEEVTYKKDLDTLIAKVQQAHTTDEANSVVDQTKHWSIEQRAPLLKAINARLVHLQKIKEQPPKPASEDDGPTLAMRISRAESLEELDQLQLEVNALDPIIHSRFKDLMDVRKEQLAKMQEA
ncbi:hypothetical protein [Acinetobacter sp. HY1485]|uniref:hypothetical protein n=1 Tax=Acinetobacter sp. HY1485 TaxID=2970918 RepID=UPI0022B9BB5E|nr:hypothetical protein [Acinetobacter sp. HY1485]